MILVSSANIMDCPMGKASVYLMNSKGARIDHWGTPCLNVPSRRKILCCLDEFISNFCFFVFI
jgi:hypothetical protein